MKFYCIRNGSSADLLKRIELLRGACETKGICFVDLDSSIVDYSNIPRPSKDDFLYNVGRGSQVLESLMLNDEVTTFYQVNPQANYNLANTSTFWTILHEKEGLPAPRTIHSLSCDRRLLDQYVVQLGGFPVIIKSVGGTRGVGVIKIDSVEALYSTADYLIASGGNFILREFIDSAARLRVVVLAGKVIAVVEYTSPPGDFRTIEDHPETKATSITAEIGETAVRAVQIMGVDVGGVDIVTDRAGRHYLLEANFPFSFQRPQEYSKVNIAGRMVDHLLAKKCVKQGG